MDSALDVHRLHFGFTITFHYLFPQLTMGLALLILILKTLALRTGRSATTGLPASGRKSSASTLPSASSPAFPWNSSSDQLGGVLSRGRRRDRADSRHGRSFLLLSRAQLSGALSLWQKQARTRWPLVGSFFCFSRLLDVWLSDRSHRRLDATPLRLPAHADGRH
jgi:hypothetical protein